MAIRDKVAAVLAFRTVPTTIIVVLVYAAIYVSVLVTDHLPYVPSLKGQRGLNLDAAYKDLHKIAGIAHPYNSHQNDVVRTHILERVDGIAESYSGVEVVDDVFTNLTFAEKALGAYFESLNVLVRINGSKPDLDAVLFSAHFDSVSTAPGATDDGMGVVTLLQLVEYFAKNQPKRTVVFNINDGEEDGLYGARAFMEHPWSNSTKTFINVEGAGAGGRPLLLRSTNTKLAKAFAHALHPHGNALSADAFNRGVVKSGTDYSVYAKGKLDGFDFAFYHQRSKYHTRDDSIPSLGGKAALWNMLESTLVAGKAVVNDEKSNVDGSEPVYFDLFGEALVVASLTTFFAVNIILLATGPLLVGILVFAAHKKRKLYWQRVGWGRFIAPFIVGGGLTFGLGVLFMYLNPFIIYSSLAPVLVSTLAASFIGVYFTLELLSYFRPVPQQCTQVLLESFIFWWIFLLFDVILIGTRKIAGLYFVTFLYAGTLAALIVALLEHFELPTAIRQRIKRTSTNGVSSVVERREAEVDGEDEPTERSPLIHRSGAPIKPSEVDEDNQIGLWLIQFLLAVPFPVILITEAAVMLLNGLSQTLAEGSPALTVYLGVSFFSLLSVLPLVPFAHKLHRSLAGILTLVLAGTILYNVFAFPFSANAPFKVAFQQTVNVDHDENLVSLSGVDPWLSRYVVPELPSSWDQDISCSSNPVRADMRSCKWRSLPPTVASGNSTDWVRVNATLSSPGKGIITVRGANSRNCRLYFDSPVTTLHVRGAPEHASRLYPLPRDGVREFRLWSRTWGREFEVEVGWKAEAGLAGRVACEWAEAGNVPALTEVVSFLPQWVRVTKKTDGLVEGWKTFSL